MSVLTDTALQARIDALQAQSVAQEAETFRYFGERAEKGDLSWDGLDADANRFMADKMVALEPEKAEFCWLLCRSLRARRVVEIGTSFGVSTLYLADAVRANGGGVVIGTEYEAAKAAKARANFAAAGLSDLIDLREGDLRETLKVIEGPVDFVLMDIWTEMARPALELVAPHLRSGAMVVADNTAQFRHAYRHFFEFVEDPKNGLKSLTLPYTGGLELVVKV
ncbi:MAG: class I SAM-dependent methyltransferase [Phenylobacterium sp.]|uniref:O-methyltransferase n=1 Tax=Phenylobacterium sp. TaxID=1871053 RepID=UPI002732E3AA|nr:class I SAM-dependent methyltransferase [Phenylobacterium sp.]MDP3749190.1 class I SAM-dependent methyltransferase [Phenylobacterium sp.]